MCLKQAIIRQTCMMMLHVCRTQFQYIYADHTVFNIYSNKQMAIVQHHSYDEFSTLWSSVSTLCSKIINC